MAEFKDAAPVDALKKGELKGLILPFYENERPLQGLTGLIDWQTIGLFSKMIQSGFINGKPGECTYIPYQHLENTWHFILLGAGISSKKDFRSAPLPKESFQNLKKNLNQLGLLDLGWSLSEFKAYDLKESLKTFSETSLWITQ